MCSLKFWPLPCSSSHRRRTGCSSLTHSEHYSTRNKTASHSLSESGVSSRVYLPKNPSPVSTLPMLHATPLEQGYDDLCDKELSKPTSLNPLASPMPRFSNNLINDTLQKLAPHIPCVALPPSYAFTMLQDTPKAHSE